MTAVVRGWRADDYADRQRRLAPTRQADGQCRACATFRLDGEPPSVHRHGCTEGPDGSQLRPLSRPEFGDPRHRHEPLFLGEVEEAPAGTKRSARKGKRT